MPTTSHRRSQHTHRAARWRLPAGLGALVWLAACGGSEVTRLESRAVIEGQVVLSATPGLNDLSRVRVSVGQGEGGVEPAADGSFRLADLEPDLYTLRVVYSGGLVPEAQGSAYRPLSLGVTAVAGSATNVGQLTLLPGSGSVSGSLALPLPGDLGPEQVSLRLLGALDLQTGLDGAGAFSFAGVPVGSYTLVAGLSGDDTSACLAPTLTVGWDGHSLALDPVSMAGTAVSWSSLQVNPFGELWYTSADSLTLAVDAPFATQARIWLAGAYPGPFLPFDGSLSIAGLAEGDGNLLSFQFRNGCGVESRVYTQAVWRDSQAPVPGFVRIAQGAAVTAELVTLVELEASGADQMQVSCDGSTDE